MEASQLVVSTSAAPIKSPETGVSFFNPQAFVTRKPQQEKDKYRKKSNLPKLFYPNMRVIDLLASRNSLEQKPSFTKKRPQNSYSWYRCSPFPGFSPRFESQTAAALPRFLWNRGHGALSKELGEVVGLFGSLPFLLSWMLLLSFSGFFKFKRRHLLSIATIKAKRRTRAAYT